MQQTVTGPVMTTEEIAARFNTLAQEEKWFEIQDELFADSVRSMDPPDSPYFGYAEGRLPVRRKGEEFVGKIEALHHAYTSEPLVCGNHFTVGRVIDVTLRDMGRIQIEQIMLYQVQDGLIVLEQFFY